MGLLALVIMCVADTGLVPVFVSGVKSNRIYSNLVTFSIIIWN